MEKKIKGRDATDMEAWHELVESLFPNEYLPGTSLFK